MPSIRFALEKLDNAVNRLDSSVTHVENAFVENALQTQSYPSHEIEEQAPQLRDNAGNVIDVDFVAGRLDKAIDAVEKMLMDEGK